MKVVEEERKNLSAADIGHVNTDGPGKAPNYVLLPGDPNRVALMAELWDGGKQGPEGFSGSPEVWTLARQAKAAVGTYKGTEIGAWSTGIGGPSAEFTFTDVIGRGGETFIRVGTTGTIQPYVNIGDIIINDANIRLDGTSDLYARKEFPAAASFEVTMALVKACENLGIPYHVGTGCTSASFFTGQCRPGYKGYHPSYIDDMLEDLKAQGVLNFEMEGATLSTLARIYGKRFGMCAVVVAHRLTGEWLEDPKTEQNACLVGAEALRILAEWDEKKKVAGKKYYFPGL
ncbi:MAG: nucleoside phosphorylase [Clostridia bacterium]|nr:nucleoside phosphorylase [Clostridia bacterium]